MEKLLFTPGPLTTSERVKNAANKDLGSRDIEFIQTVRFIRNKLLELCNVSQKDGYDSIIMQGSGTFGIESVISSVIPEKAILLNLINGAYGRRISKIANIHKIPTIEISSEENEYVDNSKIIEILKKTPEITHISVVHCETTSGIINPIEIYSEIAQKYKKSLIIDAMSSFGAYEIDLNKIDADYIISSSNKCIQGIPGFSFVIAKKEQLLVTSNIKRSLSLNLLDQWKGLESNGQFRFTPPVQSILAFKEALDELLEEGGIKARKNRYCENHNILVKFMRDKGFREYLPRDKQGCIINSFYYPDHPNFDFNEFYHRLREKGFVIYPGKISRAKCFRIGTIGNIFQKDIIYLTNAIDSVIDDMGIKIK